MLFKRQHCCLGGWGIEPNNIVYHQRNCFLLQHFLLGTDTPTSGEVVRKHLHLTRFARAACGFFLIIRCWKQLSWKLWRLELCEIRDTFHIQFLDLKRFDRKQIYFAEIRSVECLIALLRLCWNFFRPESVYNVPISNPIKSIPNAELFWLQETCCRICLRKMETQSVALSAIFLRDVARLTAVTLTLHSEYGIETSVCLRAQDGVYRDAHTLHTDTHTWRLQICAYGNYICRIAYGIYARAHTAYTHTCYV